MATLLEGLASCPVYIHCLAGVERTEAVLAAYLARRDGRSLEETLRRIDESGSGLRPLSRQVEAVRNWLNQS